MQPSALAETPPPALALVSAVIPEGIARRLEGGGAALEVGCGMGVGCLAMAGTFPALQVTGHDQDRAAIAHTRELAATAGLGGRLRFEVSDSLRLPRGTLDLVVVSGGRPDAAQLLNVIRNALCTEGACLLIGPGLGQTLAALALGAGFSRLTPLPGHDLYELRR